MCASASERAVASHHRSAQVSERYCPTPPRPTPGLWAGKGSASINKMYRSSNEEISTKNHKNKTCFLMVSLAADTCHIISANIRRPASRFSFYHLVMTNNSPWKITMLLIGKPSISMGHLAHGYVK